MSKIDIMHHLQKAGVSQEDAYQFARDIATHDDIQELDRKIKHLEQKIDRLDRKIDRLEQKIDKRDATNRWGIGMMGTIGLAILAALIAILLK